MTVVEEKKNKKQEIIKFKGEFMGFATDEHTRTIINEAAKNIWREASVSLAQFETVYTVLKKNGLADVTLVDLSLEEDIRYAAQDLIELNKNKALIIVGRENEVSLYRDLLEMGVQDYLVKPVTAHEVQRSLNRAMEANIVIDEDDIKSEIITIIGTRGGVGTSTIAANLAWIIAEDMNHNTCLLDFDLHYGTNALNFDIQPCIGLRDAIQKPDRMDNLLFSSALVKVTSKLKIFAAEENPENEIRIAPAAAKMMTDFSKEIARYSILDMPRTHVHLYETMFTASDILIVVSDLSLAGIRDSVRLKEAARKAAPKLKIIFVVNKHQDTHAQVSEKDFERGVGEKITMLIPDDPNPIGKAANAGCAISKLDQNCKSVQALKKLCGTMVQGQHAEKSGWLNKIFKNKEGQ